MQAAREYGVGVLLVGPQDAIRAELAKQDTTGLDLEIVHTDEVIGMDEHPAEAVRNKKRNSITLCAPTGARRQGAGRDLRWE